MVPELIPVLDSQPAGDVSHKPGGRLPLLSARPAVTPATLKRAATSFCCLVNRGTMGVNSLPKTVTGQHRGCDFNPGPSAPESSTLTTRLPSYPRWSRHRSLPQSRQTPVIWSETAAADAVVCACSTRKPIVPTAFGRRRAVSEYRRIKNHQNLSLRPSINNVNFTGCSCTWHRRSILMQKFLIVLSCSR